MSILFNLGNEVNAIYLTFAKELRLHIRPTNIKDQKIDNIMLNIYKIVIIVFSVIDKAN